MKIWILSCLIITLLTSSAFADKISDYYRVYSGTRVLSQAKIVLIGEEHTYSSDVKMEAEVINAYASVPDVLLVEGASKENLDGYGDSLRDGTPILAIRIRGWDDLFLNAFQRRGLKIILACANVLDDKSATIGHKSKAVVGIWLWKWYTGKIEEDRNDKMVEAIKATLSEFPNAKLFITAGKAHFVGSSKVIDYLKTSGFPFSVIVPTENNPNRKVTSDALDYGHTVASVDYQSEDACQ